LLLLVQVANSSVASRQDLENIQKQVEQKSLEHKQLQQQAQKINQEVTQISRQVVQRAKQIQAIEDKTSEMENELLKLQKELKEAEEAFIAEDENLIKTLYALQSLALKPTEALFVQPLTPVEIIRSAMLLRETVPFLAEEASQIREKLHAIANKKERIEAQVIKITDSKERLEKEHQQMKTMMVKKSETRKQIESKSAETEKKIKQLAGQAKDIKELLTKLESERVAREKLERERLEQERRIREQARLERMRQGYQNDEPEQTQSDDLINYDPEFIKNIGRNFAKAKGKLSRPARGPIITAYGQETAKGVTSKGIDIKTRREAQVISPFDGSVIFAGPFRGYGRIIIIEHGGGYMSLLAGLGQIDTEVGQMLLAGEPIGQMPDDDEAKLYVELRKDSKTVDPIAWMAK